MQDINKITNTLKELQKTLDQTVSDAKKQLKSEDIPPKMRDFLEMSLDDAVSGKLDIAAFAKKLKEVQNAS